MNKGKNSISILDKLDPNDSLEVVVGGEGKIHFDVFYGNKFKGAIVVGTEEAIKLRDFLIEKLAES